MRVRRNADRDLRDLERSASGGDAEGAAAVARARRRAGEDVRTWETDPIGQTFLQAFLLGKEGRVEAKRKGGKVERFYLSANRLPDRGALGRGPMLPFLESWQFHDWRPWVDDQGVVVVPQESVSLDTRGTLDTLYKIATRYNLTPDEIWDANLRGEVEWPGEEGMEPLSLNGIHPWWIEWDEAREQGMPPPTSWPTGNYGAWINLNGVTDSPAERWRFHNLYLPWIETGTVGGWGTPHWITAPPSGRWSVLFKTTRNAGRNDEFGDRGTQDNNALRPSDYEWARIMTKKGKTWKNPPVRRCLPRPDRRLKRSHFGPGELFHVRLLPAGKRSGKQLMIRTGIPRLSRPDEDRTIKRASFAPSPGEALAAIEAWNVAEAGLRIHIYSNTGPVEGRLPPMTLVPDAQQTGEVWCRCPVPVARIAVLTENDTRAVLIQAYYEWEYLNTDEGLTIFDALPSLAGRMNEEPPIADLMERLGWDGPGIFPRGTKAGMPVKCNPPVRVRRNADDRLRQLERAAAGGDQEAFIAYVRELRRIGNTELAAEVTRAAMIRTGKWRAWPRLGANTIQDFDDAEYVNRMNFALASEVDEPIVVPWLIVEIYDEKNHDVESHYFNDGPYVVNIDRSDGTFFARQYNEPSGADPGERGFIPIWRVNELHPPQLGIETKAHAFMRELGVPGRFLYNHLSSRGLVNIFADGVPVRENKDMTWTREDSEFLCTPIAPELL